MSGRLLAPRLASVALVLLLLLPATSFALSAPKPPHDAPHVEWAAARTTIGPVTICSDPLFPCAPTDPNGTTNTTNDINLGYGGGPVLHAPKVYVTYWDWAVAGDPDGAEPYFDAFFQGVGGSAWANIQTQYHGPNNVSITNPSNQWGGAWHDDSTTVPPVSDVSTTSVFVEKEVALAVAHFGYDPNGLYFVMLPHGYDIDFAQGYCAYHGSYVDGLGRVVAYSTMPYVSDTPTVAQPGGTPVAGCGVNFIPGSHHPKLDAFSMVGGHEYAEAVTDVTPPSGWYTSNGGENGDKCQFLFTGPGQYQEITLSTGIFGVQGLWSNRDKGCIVRYP